MSKIAKVKYDKNGNVKPDEPEPKPKTKAGELRENEENQRFD